MKNIKCCTTIILRTITGHLMDTDLGHYKRKEQNMMFHQRRNKYHAVQMTTTGD